MSEIQDLIRKLRRNADDVEQAASKEQGTLRAYWLGLAAGLRMAVKDLQGHQTYEEIQQWVARPAVKAKQDDERCRVCGGRWNQSTACRQDFHKQPPADAETRTAETPHEQDRTP